MSSIVKRCPVDGQEHPLETIECHACFGVLRLWCIACKQWLDNASCDVCARREADERRRSAWYYARGGVQFGPFRTRQLKELAAIGELLPTDMIWKEGLASWVPAGKTQNLFPTPSSPREKDGLVLVETANVASPFVPSGVSSPSSAPASAMSRAAASAAVSAPAMAVLIAACLSSLVCLLGFCVALLGAPQPGEADGNAGMAIYYLLGLCLNGVSAYGGLQMMNLRMHSLAVIASAIAILPCSACCILGAPIGIWSLNVLNRPEIKSAFEH